MAEDDSFITEALAKLEAEDVEAARDAGAAINSLTWGQGLSVITQERLQHFLWYGLPMKWLTDTDHHRRIVAALARAFDFLDLPRYAALCRSHTTAQVLDAYERSDGEGKKAFLTADAASGIHPPDIDELEWGSVMGMEESTALSSTRRDAGAGGRLGEAGARFTGLEAAPAGARPGAPDRPPDRPRGADAPGRDPGRAAPDLVGGTAQPHPTPDPRAAGRGGSLPGRASRWHR
ncbi:MAG: hypothetical protein KY447_11490 [Actinobacteria bacterium]|nr:hypothetical protein [Actinomycetota bacterium]